MEIRFLGLIAACVLSVGVLCVGPAQAEVKAEGKSHLIKPVSEQLKLFSELEGLWKGRKKNHEAEGMIDVEVEYYLSSGGSALIEKLFRGSPFEMVSVYHDDGKDLLMTHYCGFGNQPRMRSEEGFKNGKVHFQFVDGTNMQSLTDPHMHELTITFLGKDRIKHEWVSYKDGKKGHIEAFELKRVK